MNIIKYIERTNQEFEEANPERKRVMIAEDVILRIKERNIIPKKERFFVNDDLKDIKGSSLKDYVNGNACIVCAKGGLLCSFVGRVNELRVGVVFNTTNNGEDAAHEKLRELFTFEQLDLIETAFEGQSYMNVLGEDTLYPVYDEAKEFYYSYDNADTRLIAICQNIIDNNGTFVPQ